MPVSANTQSHTFSDRQILAAAGRVPSFEEALARLLYVVEHRRPCGLVIGLAGTGKSVLLESVFHELSRSEASGTDCLPLQLNLRAAGNSELAWVLATEMGLSPRDHSRCELLWRSIEDRFQGVAMSGQSIVPIIDHLEQTDREAVVDLNRCCHLAVRYDSTVLLSARPHVNSSLAEVIGPLCDLRVELPLWTRGETAQFVTDLFRGARPSHLEVGAIDVIHACAGGRMRDTVQVLRLATFAAQAQGLEKIDADLVRTVAGEIWQPAAHTLANATALPPSAALASARN